MSKLRTAIFVALFVILSPAWLDAEQEKDGKLDKAEAIKAELKKLEGRWIVTKSEVLGKESIPKKLVVVIQDGRLSYHPNDSGKPSNVSRIELDPTTTPKVMDLVVLEGVAKKGSTALAIYRFNEEGDLEICYPASNDKNPKRPTAFTTKPGVGSGGIYRVMKRDDLNAGQKKDVKADKTDKAEVKKADPEKDPPKGWKAYAGGFKKEAYIVWLPTNGKIDETESQILGKQYGQIRIFRTNCQRRDGSLFAAGQIILPPQLVKESIKIREAFFRDLFLDEVKGTLIEEKNVKLGVFSGKEFTAKTPNGMARYRLYGTGVQLFRVLAVGSKEQVEGKDAETFFESFRRTPPKETSKDK